MTLFGLQMQKRDLKAPDILYTCFKSKDTNGLITLQRNPMKKETEIRLILHQS